MGIPLRMKAFGACGVYRLSVSIWAGTVFVSLIMFNTLALAADHDTK